MLSRLEQRIRPLSRFQGGFRAGHCCNDLVLVVDEALRTGSAGCCAFLDIRAAYDSVDRRKLWRKCGSKGLDSATVGMLRQLFDHNSSQVVIDGFLSEPFGISSGVLQGSALSPFLYSIFIDDLPEWLSGLSKCKVGGEEMNIVMYADDIALLAEDGEKLQELIDGCQEHAERNRYRFNVRKCAVIGKESMEIRSPGVEQLERIEAAAVEEGTIPEFMAPMDASREPEMLQQVEAFTYLGVEISARGIEEESFIRRRIEGTEKAAVALGRLGANIGGFSTRTCSLLYRTFLRSKLEAGLCIIGQTAGRKQKVESCQQRMMARLMGVGPKTSGAIMRGLLGLPKMSARWNQLRIGYVRRVERLKGLDYLVETALKDSGKMKKLGGRMPAREVTLGQLATKALEEVGKEAAGATGGHLKLGSLRKRAWFLRSGRLGRQESRMINLAALW